MREEEKPAGLDESLLDKVLARLLPEAYRPRRPSQPRETFINRSGEIAGEGRKGGTPHPP